MALSKWAIIDIGSNTIRLVIYKMNPFGSMKETDNIKASARLRNYVNKEGVLDEEGKRILVNTLKGFKEIADFQGIEEVICVATAALRQAKNKQSIVCEIKEVTGFEVRILTEEEEAFYGFYAVVNSTTQQDGITIDIGGGSTEITYFKKRKLIYSHSYPFGVVSLKEQFMSSGTMNGQECAALQQFLQRKFKELPWLHRLSVPIVAIGGSARNVAQIHQNIIKYPIAGIHQYKMELRDLLMMKEMMSQMTISDLEKLEGLSKERADIILPALEVFVQLCFYSNSNEFIFSRRGLRDGIYFKEYKLHNHSGSSEEIADESISELLNDYGVDKNHSDKVSSLAGQLASELVKMYPAALSKDFISDILIAARAYFLGDYLDTDASSQHTFYLLANQSLDGLEHLQRVKLALIASFKNKNFLKLYAAPFLEWFTKEELFNIRIAGSLVKLASALDASKRGLVRELEMKKGKGHIVLTVKCRGDFFVEKSQAEKHLRQLEKAIKTNVVLEFIPH